LTCVDNSLDTVVDRLEDALRQQQQVYSEMLTLLRRKRDAVRTADHRVIGDCCRLENEQVRKLSDLEKRRLALVGRLTELLEPAAAQPMRLLEVTDRLEEPARGRLLVLRQQTLELMQQVQAESGVVRRAAESLMRHVQGLVQSIGVAMTGVGTYGNRGNVPRAATAVSTFNTTA
jgi:hypothetical protein